MPVFLEVQHPIFQNKMQAEKELTTILSVCKCEMKGNKSHDFSFYKNERIKMLIFVCFLFSEYFQKLVIKRKSVGLTGAKGILSLQTFSTIFLTLPSNPSNQNQRNVS